MNLLRFFSCALFSSFLISCGKSGDPAVLEEVLQNHFDAAGTRTLLQKSSWEFATELTMEVEEAAVIINSTTFFKRPHLIKAVISTTIAPNIDLGESVFVYDGHKGFMTSDSDSPSFEVGGQNLVKMTREALLEGELYDYKEKGHELTYFGVYHDESVDYHRLRSVEKSGWRHDYFINSETFLIHRVETSGGGIKMQALFTGYEDFEGVVLPTVTTVNTPEGNMKSELKSVTFDQFFEDALFQHP